MTGRLGRAPDKIRMKSTGTSKTMCFEQMMHAGADLGEWIGWEGNRKRAPFLVFRLSL